MDIAELTERLQNLNQLKERELLAKDIENEAIRMRTKRINKLIETKNALGQ